jgi:hypothetical protein
MHIGIGIFSTNTFIMFRRIIPLRLALPSFRQQNCPGLPFPLKNGLVCCPINNLTVVIPIPFQREKESGFRFDTNSPSFI